jgi:hypothetical protein
MCKPSDFLKSFIYFGASLRGTTQYWSQRGKELRALIQYQINEKQDLLSFFTIGSCADYHWKPLRKLFSKYIYETSRKEIDFSNRSDLFCALQKKYSYCSTIL